MKLRQAFQITRGDVVALVGAGGKTSTLMALAHELADEGWRVLTTTTTRIAEEELRLMPHAIQPQAGAQAISDALAQHRFTFVYSDIRGGKAYGVASAAWLLDSVDADVLIVEAPAAERMDIPPVVVAGQVRLVDLPGRPRTVFYRTDTGEVLQLR